MTGCRIGKVKFKTGGSLHLLKDQPRFECQNAVSNLADLVDEDTLFVGFVVLRKSRSINCGWSYSENVGPTDMIGACEILREDILKKEWP